MDEKVRLTKTSFFRGNASASPPLTLSNSQLAWSLGTRWSFGEKELTHWDSKLTREPARPLYTFSVQKEEFQDCFRQFPIQFLKNVKSGKELFSMCCHQQVQVHLQCFPYELLWLILITSFIMSTISILLETNDLWQTTWRWTKQEKTTKTGQLKQNKT